MTDLIYLGGLRASGRRARNMPALKQCAYSIVHLCGTCTFVLKSLHRNCLKVHVILRESLQTQGPPGIGDAGLQQASSAPVLRRWGFEGFGVSH